jgi:hypothetical protein
MTLASVLDGETCVPLLGLRHGKVRASQFLSHRAKHQAPNPKLQRSSKSQNTKPHQQMSSQRARRSVFELGAWCFFGDWSWEFGASFPGAQLLKKEMRPKVLPPKTGY